MTLTTTHGRTLGALVTATALTATTLMAAPATAADADSTRDHALTEGSFTWGINNSFLGYLSSPAAGGQITATEGADFAEGEFTFPVNTEDSTIDADGNAVIELDGGIDLKAHAGSGPEGGWGLDIQYDDLTLTITGTSAALTGDYTIAGARSGGDDAAGGAEAGDDVTLITFSLDTPITPATGEFLLTDVSTLAAQGVTDSLGSYPVGTELAPADLSLSFTEQDTPVEGSDSSTGIFSRILGAITAAASSLWPF